MQSVRQKVARAAGLNVPVLVLGESGTGKEVLARSFTNDLPGGKARL
jgi:DNA-binding NtrC family response regulator